LQAVRQQEKKMANVSRDNPVRIDALAVSEAHPQIHYVDWGAILAGAVVAAAILTLMTAFGAAVGLSAVSPYSGSGLSAVAMGLAAALWVLWIGVSSFAAGGYIAGRMRRRIHDANEHESDVRDGAHGLIVWALGSLLIAYLATASVAALTKAASSTAAAGAAVLAGSAQSPTSVFDPASFSARLWRTSQPDKATPDSIRQDAARILAVSAANGSISGEDKAYLTAEVAARTGLNEQDAGKRVDETMAQISAAAEKVRQAAESARKAGVLAAFLSAAALALSAAAAWWAACMGGKHRDEGIDLSHLTAWK
jgi:hypothetical protein